MYGNANNIVSDEFALASMQTATDPQIERAHRVTDRARATHGTRRPVERGKKAVAGGVDFAPTILAEHAPSFGIERIQQDAPGTVAKCGGAFRRSCNVDKQHSRKHPIRLRCLPMPGDELFDLIKNFILIANPDHMVLTAELNQFGAGNLLRHVARMFYVNHPLISAMQNQGWYARDGQNVSDIDLPVHTHDRRSRAGAC